MPPERYPIVPYLCVSDARRAFEFYQSVFGAKELVCYVEDDGRIGHLTMEIEGAEIFMSDVHPEIGVISPTTLGGTAVTLHLLVPRVDEVVQLAADHGARITRPPGDQPFGERIAKLTDPFGHDWMVASLI